VSRKTGLLLFAACLAVAAGACHSDSPPKAPENRARTARGAPVDFRYEDVQKGVLDSSAMRGLPSVIIFIATYDIASQAQARFLTMIERRHHSRIRVAAIVLERSENLPLVVAFRDSLHLDYPIAMGDGDLVSGRGPFGDVHVVPTTILLDQSGRIAWRNVGLAKDTDIEAALRSL
jgi:hypothetical protein